MAGDEHMTDAVNEQLSTCLDGELSAAELDLLLKRLERDAELRDALGRYTVIGEALRNTRPVVASRSFADKVMAAVEQQPAAVRRGFRVSPILTRSLRPVAGIGIAATVAALAIFSVQRAGVQTPGPIAANEPAVAPTAIVAQSSDGPASYIVPTSTSQAAFVPATRLTNYVVAHSEYSSPLARRSVLTGVLAEDDSDPDVATDDAQESQSPPSVSPPAQSQSQ
jgi:sigma-E factor negative regulatory protein RseA